MISTNMTVRFVSTSSSLIQAQSRPIPTTLPLSPTQTFRALEALTRIPWSPRALVCPRRFRVLLRAQSFLVQDLYRCHCHNAS